MFTVTERFVGGLSAPAERYTVADFVNKTIGCFYGDATAHPNWSVHAGNRVKNQSNGRFEFRFNEVSKLVAKYQPSGWSITHFLKCYFPCFRIVG